MRPSRQKILLVEDEPLIAMEMEDLLSSLIISDLVIAYDLVSGLLAAERYEFDFAILDFNLSGGTDSIPIAQRLIDRGVPFAFVSGNVHAVKRTFPSAVVAAKPVDASTVESLVLMSSLNR